jgi:hypothetical protein
MRAEFRGAAVEEQAKSLGAEPDSVMERRLAEIAKPN